MKVIIFIVYVSIPYREGTYTGSLRTISYICKGMFPFLIGKVLTGGDYYRLFFA